MTIPSDSYSQAPRCAPCGGRAVLTKEKAQALVNEAFGNLEMFACREDAGWHVWAPTIEKGSLSHTTAW